MAEVLPNVSGLDRPLQVQTPEHLQLTTDRVKLAQALSNLLDNAARFSPPGSPIEIRAAQDQGETVEADEARRVREQVVVVHCIRLTLIGVIGGMKAYDLAKIVKKMRKVLFDDLFERHKSIDSEREHRTECRLLRKSAPSRCKTHLRAQKIDHILRIAGITDLTKYAIHPGAELIPDLFL